MKEKIFNLLGIRPKGVILCRSKTINGKTCSIIMQSITEQEEIRIDKSINYYPTIRYERDDGYIVNGNYIYLYGEVDFNNQDDLDNIDKFYFIDNNEIPNFIQSTFDFDKGTFMTIDGIAKGSPTWNNLDWFKYCYVLLGKPKRIIVYSCPDYNINRR